MNEKSKKNKNILIFLITSNNKKQKPITKWNLFILWDVIVHYVPRNRFNKNKMRDASFIKSFLYLKEQNKFDFSSI